MSMRGGAINNYGSPADLLKSSVFCLQVGDMRDFVGVPDPALVSGGVVAVHTSKFPRHAARMGA